MKRYIELLIMAVVAISLTGCMATSDAMPDHDSPAEPKPPGKPTVPIKRRPIVPGTKLPRPRVVEYIGWVSGSILELKLAERVPSAEVVISDEATGEEFGYIFEGDHIEIAVPDDSVRIEIRIGKESYIYNIESDPYLDD